MDIIKQIGSFLGWLSGVLAGVAAVLYGLGFLATSAHQRALGMSWSGIVRDPLSYLELGGAIAASWLLFGTLALIGVAVALAIGRGLLSRLRGGGNAGTRVRLAEAIETRRLWIAVALLLALLAQTLKEFDNALAMQNLLFATDAELCDLTGAQAELARGQQQRLYARVSLIYLLASLSLCLIGFSARQILTAPPRVVPIVICIGAGLTALAQVPTAHGIFAMRMDLPEIRPVGELPEGFPDRDLRLVASARDGLWIWDPAGGAVHWLARDRLTHLRYTPPRPLRDLSCPEDAPAQDSHPEGD